MATFAVAGVERLHRIDPAEAHDHPRLILGTLHSRKIVAAALSAVRDLVKKIELVKPARRATTIRITVRIRLFKMV
jgi:hypothetical protein